MRWDMTVGSDEERWVHPIGYCGGWRGDPDDAEKERLNAQFGPHFSEGLQREWEAKRPFKDKFHSDGHATSEEAAECWRQYRLDTELEFLESKTQQRKCQVCDAWTLKFALLGREFSEEYVLCDEHCTRENVERLENARMEKHKARR